METLHCIISALEVSTNQEHQLVDVFKLTSLNVSVHCGLENEFAKYISIHVCV